MLSPLSYSSRKVSRHLIGRLFSCAGRRNRSSFTIVLFTTFALIFLFELLLQKWQSWFEISFDFFSFFLMWLPLPFSPAMPENLLEFLPHLGGGAFMVCILILRWVQLCISVQRLHDIGLPGFFFVLLLIPKVHFVFFFMLALWPGKKRRNRYGAVPREIDFIFESPDK